MSTDRTHILNVSWNAFLPDGAKGGMDNPIGRGLLNGWQLSGISSMASGIPIRLSFVGDAGAESISAAYFGTADVVGPSFSGGNGLSPKYSCDPRLPRNRSRRKDPRRRLYRGAGRSERTATSYRRTTSGRPHGSTTT